MESLRNLLRSNNIPTLIVNLIVDHGVTTFQALSEFNERDIYEIERLVREGKLMVKCENWRKFSFHPWQKKKVLELCSDLKVSCFKFNFCSMYPFESLLDCFWT